MFEADAERSVDRVVEGRVAGQVLEVADDHPVAVRERDRGRGAQQIPRRNGDCEQQNENLDAEGCRAAPERYFAVRLAGPRWRLQRSEPFVADLEHRRRIRNALEAIATVAAPAQRGQLQTELTLRTIGERVGNAGQQNLVRQRELHQARGDRLDQAFDFDALGALRDVFGRVVEGEDVADMDADACGDHVAIVLGDFFQPTHVSQRESDRLHRTIEHEQEAVGLVDFLTRVRVQQGTRHAVVLAEQFRGALIAKALDQRCGIDQIAEHEGAQQRHRGRWRIRWRGLDQCIHVTNALRCAWRRARSRAQTVPIAGVVVSRATRKNTPGITGRLPALV